MKLQVHPWPVELLESMEPRGRYDVKMRGDGPVICAPGPRHVILLRVPLLGVLGRQLPLQPATVGRALRGEMPLKAWCKTSQQ